MLEFLETGKALYVLAAVCILGLLGRLVARNLYKRLMKETDNMTLTKNRYLRDLKQKTENTYRLNQGIRNSRVYLEKQLTSYHFLGMSLSGWASFGGQMTILCFLLGGAASFGAYWYRCDSYYIVLYGSVGILAGLMTMMADYWANLSERKQQLLNSLQDYMENSLFNRLMRETAITIGEEARRENGQAAGNGTARTADRRNRTDKAVRAIVNPTGSGGSSIENHGGYADKGTEDREFAAKDLESLGKTGYGTSGELAAAEPIQERMVREGKEGRAKKERLERTDEAGSRSQRRNLRAVKKNQDAENMKEQEGSRREEDYLKNSLEQIAASRERNRTDGEWIKDLSPDELELVGQILKQYLV